MKKIVNIIYTCMLGAASVFATQPSNPLSTQQVLQKADKQFFIENKGQWHPDVLFLTRMGGLDVWITKYGVNYTFYKIEKYPKDKEAEHLPSKFDHAMEDATLLGHRVLMKLQNPNVNPLTQGKLKQIGYYNYLIGSDPSKHASNVGLYKEVVVKGVYNGIDLRYYFDNGYLRYDFVIQPGADPSQIKFELVGEYNEYLKNGALCYTTRFGEVQMQDLYVYQQGDKKQIPAKFTQQNGVWQFQLSDYDKNLALVIDPLIYSTYIGGSGDDFGNAIALDASGNAYITGYTTSNNYDITTGVFQTTIGGFRDVFVTKLNSTGTGLIYSTYIGGSGNDEGRGITVDSFGNAYVTGFTNSSNFDTTPNTYQTTFSGGSGHDAFVTKLNSTGTGLIYSTYIGGSGNDEGRSIAIDNLGNAYITGFTQSTNFYTTPGAFQRTYGGNGDVFVTKFNSTGTNLMYSTYLGGSNGDGPLSIAIDGSGSTYITGTTFSNNFYTTVGSFQTNYAGGWDAFVTKLDSTGTAAIYSTYIGGDGMEFGYGIAVDGLGNAYITGYTNSTNYHTTSGAFQTSLEGANDAFVTKLNSMGTSVIYSTYIGGSSNDEGRGIAIDGSGNAYITGITNSSNYDTTSGAFQTSFGGGSNDVFVSKLNSTGTTLVYSTYIGGTGNDEGRGIAIDASGNAYITGITASTNYDITPGAFQTSNNGGASDVFVSKFCTPPSPPSNITGNLSVCAGSSQTYTVAAVLGATSYTWTLPNGWTGSSTTNSITVTVGANSGNITVTANNGCGISSPTTLAVVVNTAVPAQPSAIIGDTTVCQSSTLTYSVAAVPGASSYTWTLPSGWTGGSRANTIQVSAGSNGGTITVTANNVCGSSVPQTLAVSINPTVQISSITGDTSACLGSSATFSVNATGPIGTYQWRKNGVNINGADSATYTIPSVSPSSSGSYDVVISNTNSCPNVISSPIILNVPFTVVSNGLVFYLPFDGNTTEFINNTSSSGSYTYVGATDRFGKPNGAANFTANTFREYATYPGQPTGNSPYTISTWINVANGQWNTSNGICGWGNQSINQRNSLRLDYSGYVNYWWINDFNATIPPAQVQTGVWKHIVVTYDGTTQRFYENGVQIATRVPTTTANVALTTTVVGAGLPNNQYYKGMLDELRIYNRAITAAEVSTLYNYIPLTAASLPATQTVCAGSNFTQTVNVTGSGGLTYQWYFNGKPLSDGGAISGTQTATLSIANVSAAHAGNYTVHVTQNSCFTVVSDTMALNIDSIVITAQPTNQTICVNQPLNLSVTAIGTGLNYQWTLNGNNIPGATSATYSVDSASAADSGNYQVVVSNNNCLIASNVVNVVISATAPAQPNPITGNTIVCQNSTQTYIVAEVPGATSYTWTLPSGWRGNSITNSITATVGSNGDTISVIANNGCGSSAAQTLAITVNPLPNVTVSSNANTLTANQAGATYQWIDCNNNNTLISGATSQSFTPTTSGSYAVIVTWNGCSDTSACQNVIITGIGTQVLSKLSFTIYPNPNRGNFTIQTERGGVFELIDLVGKVINTYTITNKQQTVQESLPAGMYFVREKNNGIIQKLIIE